jgi:hypothetical protein
MAGRGAAGVFHEAVSCFYVDDVSASAGGSGVDGCFLQNQPGEVEPHACGSVFEFILDWSGHKINVARPDYGECVLEKQHIR